MRITVIAYLEGKIVSKYCNISKTPGGGGGGHPPPLYHGGGMNLHVRPRINNKNGTIRKQEKKIACNKKPVNFALHCIEHYDHCCSMISASRTHCSYKKNVNPGKRVALFAEYFLSFFFFFFLVRKKLTPLLKPTSFAHALTRQTVGRAKLFI